MPVLEHSVPETRTPTQHFFGAVKSRISCYGLKKESPISDEKINLLVSFSIKHAPAPFNVQSARAVVLLKADHEKLWDMADAAAQKAMPPAVYQSLQARIQGFRAAYGSVVWFEDQAALDALGERNPGVKGLLGEWSHESSGMHQFITWTAMELEGLGCNLQHYTFFPELTQQVLEEWNLPKTWNMRAQLIFGTPNEGLVRRHERTYEPLEGRVKMFGSS